MISLLRFLPFFLLLIPACVHGEDSGLLLTQEIQLKLADSFMDEGEYYRAITEYKKLLVLFPDSSKLDYAGFRIGSAYYRGDEYEPAAREFASVVRRYPKSRYAPEATYTEGLSYVWLNRYDRAETAFTKVLADYPESEHARRSRFGNSLIAFDRQDFAASRRHLETFIADYPDDGRVGNAREAAALLEAHRDLPQKSPVTAGILSAIVPGSGHMYAGHYGDGITALMLNGLFIAGTVVAIQQENYAVAGIVGVIGVPFYIGNIYGAANAATKYNVGVRKDLRGRFSVTLDYRF